MDSFISGVIAFLILQVLFVAGRVYVRTCVVKAFGKDDVACLITLVFACAYDGCVIALWPLSHLKAYGDFPLENAPATINLVLSILCLYIIGTMLLKIALGLLLLRVLVKRWMEMVVYVVCGISVAYGLAFFFVVLFQCGNPIYFSTRILGGQCLTRETVNGMSYTHAVLTALADIIFASLPVVFLWNAAFSRRAKISVGGILLLGSVGCICTLVRIGWIGSLTAPTLTYLLTARTIGLLSAIELSIGLMCISLATYRPLLHRFIRRRNQSYYYNGSQPSDADSQHEEMTNGGQRYTNSTVMSPASTFKASDSMEKTWQNPRSMPPASTYKPSERTEKTWQNPRSVPASSLRSPSNGSDRTWQKSQASPTLEQPEPVRGPWRGPTRI